MRLLHSRKWLTAIAVLAVFALTAAGFAFRNQEAISEQITWYLHRKKHLEGSNEMCRDLARGRFKAGDAVENLIAAYPPDEVVYGRTYTEVHYVGRPGQHDSVLAIARNGRLACLILGNSTENMVAIFSTMSDAEHRAAAAENGYARDRHTARMAAAGFGATIEPWDL